MATAAVSKYAVASRAHITELLAQRVMLSVVFPALLAPPGCCFTICRTWHTGMIGARWDIAESLICSPSPLQAAENNFKLACCVCFHACHALQVASWQLARFLILGPVQISTAQMLPYCKVQLHPSYLHGQWICSKLSCL